MNTETFVYLFQFVLGLVTGSFINVCIWRLPEGKLFSSSRSRCPACGHEIAWYDNIPLLSYVLLAGRCRNCKNRISLLYPLVEMITGLSFAAMFHLYENVSPAVYAVHLVFLCAVIVATFTDLRERIIPNEITITGILTAPIVCLLVPQLQMHGPGISFLLPIGNATVRMHVDALFSSLFGIITGGGIVYLTGLLGGYAFKKEAMGGGDVKLMAMAGGILGWKYTLLAFFTAPFLALPFAVANLLISKDHSIAFGPFLSVALVTAMLWGEQIIALLVGR